MRRGVVTVTIAAIIGFASALNGVAEPLSKIAVVDFARVFESFPEQARLFDELDDLLDDYDRRMAEYADQLDQIDLEIVSAKEEDNQLEVTRLQGVKEDFLDNRRTFHEIMTRRKNAAYQKIADGQGMAQEILKAIDYVAINEGYSMVLDATDHRIWWFSQEIDITDLVINRLRVIQ